jgi:hypothetical protein
LLITAYTLTKRNTITGKFCYLVARFFLNQRKRKKNPDERMNFAIFSYKIAMQIYFKSLIAPNMLLCQKKQKIKNRNPYSTRWPLKNNKPCYTSAKQYRYQIFKNNKKKRFFFLAEKMKECPVGKKTKTNIDEKR